jgi:nucleotide-binding universal stress UspA family protein
MSTIPVIQRIGPKNVLFLTDFSEPSAAALPFAAMIARSFGAKVTALHVLVPSVYTYMTPEMRVEHLDAQDDGAKTELEKVEAEFVGLSHEAIVERDTGVWPVLSKMLRERDIDLIVLGTHGRTGLKKAVFGSTAEEIFRRAAVPVLTIGPEVRTGAHNGGHFHCVLFATDFNTISSTAAAYAMSLAQENQSRLVLLHVLPAPTPEKARSAGQLSVAEALHRVEELLPWDGELCCRPEPTVEHGDAGTQILATAERCGVDLIVLGVRGMDTLTEVVTRGERATAYEVIARARCPVLTVRG